MTDMTVVVGKIMGVFGTLVWKITECSELNKMFCEKLVDKNIERKADDGGLACGVSERFRDSIGDHSWDIF